MESVDYIFHKFLDTYLLPAVSSTFIALMYFVLKRRDKKVKKEPQTVLSEIVIHEKDRKAKKMVTAASNIHLHFLGDHDKESNHSPVTIDIPSESNTYLSSVKNDFPNESKTNFSSAKMDIPNESSSKNSSKDNAYLTKFNNTEFKCSSSEAGYINCFLFKSWGTYDKIPKHIWCDYYHLNLASSLNHEQGHQLSSKNGSCENCIGIELKDIDKNLKLSKDGVECSKSTVKLDDLDSKEMYSVRSLTNDKKAYMDYLHIAFHCDCDIT